MIFFYFTYKLGNKIIFMLLFSDFGYLKYTAKLVLTEDGSVGR